MRYQALALDLDGTLTNSRKEVSPATRAALGRAMFEGCKVILASGRPLVGIQPVAWALGLPRLGGYILAYNGGQVVDCRTGETLRQDRLDPAQIHRLCAFARQQGVSILTYDRDGIVTEHPEDPFVQKEAGINRIPVQKVPDLAAYVTYPITKMLLVGEPERMAAVEQAMRPQFAGQVDCYRSEACFLEAVPPGVDKAASLHWLLDHLGLSERHLMAFGDGFNDIPMLRAAGLGVAMANAQPPVKAAAKSLTDSNDEDGVAHALDKWLLG